MTPIQNMLFLTPESVAGYPNGMVVRNDETATLFRVRSNIVRLIDGCDIVIVEYIVTRCYDGAERITQIFDNVVKYVAGAKPMTNGDVKESTIKQAETAIH